LKKKRKGIFVSKKCLSRHVEGSWRVSGKAGGPDQLSPEKIDHPKPELNTCYKVIYV
jgi:hypothetical protein